MGCFAISLSSNLKARSKTDLYSFTDLSLNTTDQSNDTLKPNIINQLVIGVTYKNIDEGYLVEQLKCSHITKSLLKWHHVFS